MELLNQLASNGLLALLLAIAYVAVWFLFVQYRASLKDNDLLQEKRISDYKEFTDKYTTLAEVVRSTLTTTVDALKGKKDNA